MKAGAAGVIEAAMKVMSSHINNVVLCEYVCDILWNLTFNNGKHTDKVQQQMKMSMNS